MALPNVTPEQRAKALEKAAQVRKARKELKENIKSGKTDPASVLKTRKDDPLVSKMKVKEFLQAIPGIGGAKADKIMHGEGVAAGIKAQTEAYNGMENAYLLANRYIDVMPEVAEAVAKPLTAVDSIKMYGDGNATKLVRDTTGMVDQVTSGLKDATGIDLTELLSSFHQPFQPREDNE